MSVLILKEIHPKKLNVPGMSAAMEAAANKIADEMLLDFELTTATWGGSVKFEKLIQVGPSSIEILVGTDNIIYNYIDFGTKPYFIPKSPRPGKFIRFRSGYISKTVPGILSSRAGGSYGDFAYAKQVRHPGIEARQFSKLVKKKWEKKLKREVEKSMKAIAKASGHAL